MTDSTDSLSLNSDHQQCESGASIPAAMQKSGWLHKWTNYVKGYRRRWFVIDSSGNLKYYRKPSEVGTNCRGSVNLREARILADKYSSQLIISSGSQSYHLKAPNDIDRNQWLKALKNAHHQASTCSNELDDASESWAILYSNKNLPKSAENFDSLLNEKLCEMRDISEKIDGIVLDLKKCLSGHFKENSKALQKVDNILNFTGSLMRESQDLVLLMKTEFLNMSKYLRLENEKRHHLQEQIETLARQHSALERTAYEKIGGLPENNHPPFGVDLAAPTTESEDDTFHDANDSDFHSVQEAFSNNDNDDDTASMNSSRGGDNSSMLKSTTTTTILRTGTNCNKSRDSVDLESCIIAPSSEAQEKNNNNDNNNMVSSNEHTNGSSPKSSTNKIRRRSTIPERPNCTLNLWSIVKNSIGKELTKIPLPVNFNEPLSFLQRVAEDLENSYLLDQAAEKTDSCEQLAFIAAFAASSYSTTSNRTYKPFNPLLGETFELDRMDDLGWRCIAEQVSHHPPVAARHVEGRKWMMYHETQLISRFRGKYLSVIPVGHIHIHFTESGNHYTYQKVTTTVHNIIVGKLWIDNHGELLIQNHKTGDKGIIKFNAYTYFSTEKPRKVHGFVKDTKGQVKWAVQGYWDKYINVMKVTNRKSEGGKDVIETLTPTQVWTINPPISGSDKMYHFTKFAIELNEEDDSVAPTDSRRRPDQRLMEHGLWDDANRVKNQLEEKQRQARRRQDAEINRALKSDCSVAEYQPKWFEKTKDPYTDSVIYLVVDNEYWNCKEVGDWSRCPNIYLSSS